MFIANASINIHPTPSPIVIGGTQELREKWAIWFCDVVILSTLAVSNHQFLVVSRFIKITFQMIYNSLWPAILTSALLCGISVELLIAIELKKKYKKGVW